MPKCPNCGVEIDHLIGYRKAWTKCEFWVDEQRRMRVVQRWLNWQEPRGSEHPEQVEWQFECLECHAQLFDNPADARDFLVQKGGFDPGLEERRM